MTTDTIAQDTAAEVAAEPIACPLDGQTVWVRVETGLSYVEDIFDTVTGKAHEDRDDHDHTDSEFRCLGNRHISYAVLTDEQNEALIDRFDNAEWPI